MKSINDMSRRELLSVRTIGWDESVTPFGWVVIVPNLSWRRFVPQFVQDKIPFLRDPLHDSGYRTMTYVFGDGDEIIGKSTGGSDVLHVGGISAWIDGKPVGWNIDCLPRSGCLRMFTHASRSASGKLTTGGMVGLSSVEVMTVEQWLAREQRMDQFRKKDDYDA